MLKDYVREQIVEILKEEEINKNIQLLLGDKKLLADISLILKNKNLSEGILDLLKGPYTKKEIMLLLGILGAVYSPKFLKYNGIEGSNSTVPKEITKRIKSNPETLSIVKPLSQKAFDYIIKGNDEDLKHELINPLAVIFKGTFDLSKNNNNLQGEESEEDNIVKPAYNELIQSVDDINEELSSLKFGELNKEQFDEQLSLIKKLKDKLKKLIEVQGNEISEEVNNAVVNLRGALNYLNIMQDKDNQNTYGDDVYETDKELLSIQKKYLNPLGSSDNEDVYEDYSNDKNYVYDLLDQIKGKIEPSMLDAFNIEDKLVAVESGEMPEGELITLLQDIDDLY